MGPDPAKDENSGTTRDVWALGMMIAEQKGCLLSAREGEDRQMMDRVAALAKLAMSTCPEDRPTTEEVGN
jgi:hypothetical protein